MRGTLPITVALAPRVDALDSPRPDLDDAALVPLLTAFYDVVGRDAPLGRRVAGSMRLRLGLARPTS